MNAIDFYISQKFAAPSFGFLWFQFRLRDIYKQTWNMLLAQIAHSIRETFHHTKQFILLLNLCICQTRCKMHEKQNPIFTFTMKWTLNVKSSNHFTFAKLFNKTYLYLKQN